MGSTSRRGCRCSSVIASRPSYFSPVLSTISGPVGVCAVQPRLRRIRSSKANKEVTRRLQARLVSDRLLSELLLSFQVYISHSPRLECLLCFFQESHVVLRTRSGRLYGFCTGVECMCMVYNYGQFWMKLDK